VSRYATPEELSARSRFRTPVTLRPTSTSQGGAATIFVRAAGSHDAQRHRLAGAVGLVVGGRRPRGVRRTKLRGGARAGRAAGVSAACGGAASAARRSESYDRLAVNRRRGCPSATDHAPPSHSRAWLRPADVAVRAVIGLEKVSNERSARVLRAVAVTYNSIERRGGAPCRRVRLQGAVFGGSQSREDLSAVMPGRGVG